MKKIFNYIKWFFELKVYYFAYGSNMSLKGLINVMYYPKEPCGWDIICNEECTLAEKNEGLLQVIYENGKFYNTITFSEIREKLAKN